MRAVAEFDNRANQTHQKSKEQFKFMMMIRIADIAVNKTEIQRQCQ